jgi:hypothetical protein
MSAHSIPNYTVEQYLEMDEAAKYPLEYYDGQIVPLAQVYENVPFSGPGSDQAFNE